MFRFYSLVFFSFIFILLFCSFTTRGQVSTTLISFGSCNYKDLGTLPAPSPCPSSAAQTYTVSATSMGVVADTFGYKPAQCVSFTKPLKPVWFKFKAAANAIFISVSGTGSTPLQSPVIALCRYNNSCVNMIPIDCNADKLEYKLLVPGEEYLVQVFGSNNTNDVGDFILSLTGFNPCKECLQKAGIVVKPLPVNGAYPTDVPVNFDFYVNEFKEVNGNRLHGVVPAFGNGWDLSTLSVSVASSMDGKGDWQWYNSISTPDGTKNGFFYNVKSNSTDNDPKNNLGDRNASNGSWKFSFSIKTNTSCNNSKDLSVFVKTYSDAETGNSTVTDDCKLDSVFKFMSTLDCCNAPNLKIDSVSCPGKCDGAIILRNLGNAGTLDVVDKDGKSKAHAFVPAGGSYTVTALCNELYSVLISPPSGSSSCISEVAVLVPLPYEYNVIRTKSACDTNCTNALDLSFSLGAPSATNLYVYKWSTGETTSFISNLCPDKTYSVDVKHGNCVITHSATIYNDTTYDASFNYLQANICIKEVNNIVKPLVKKAGGIFSIQPTGINLDTVSGKIIISGNETPGSYVVKYGFKRVCPSSSVQTLELNSTFDPAFSYSDAVYCLADDSIVPLHVSTNGGHFSALPATLNIDSLTGKIKFSMADTGNYTITYSLSSGLCKTTSQEQLKINARCAIKIYKGITPNGDGKNDTWIIDGIGDYPGNKVFIFNRWGSRVWFGEGYDNKEKVWKGNNQENEPLPDGTYFYIVHAGGKTYKGWVEVTK